MNKNEERYVRSFSALHLSDDFSERLDKRLSEEKRGSEMENVISFRNFNRVAAAVAICAVTLSVSGVCYAADLGGIRTRIGLWINGVKNEVEIDQDGMGFTWTDETGEDHGFGGISLDEDGNEIPMSAEELAGYMNNECTLRPQEGRVELYYKNLSVDVTDMISGDGTLNVHIDDPLNPNTYFSFSDITPEGSYGCSSRNEPEDGVEYTELDASELVMDSEAIELQDNEEYTSYVTVTDD